MKKEMCIRDRVGYVIDSVTANGESLEAVEEDDATDSNAETGVKRFVVPEVEEEQEIVVTMAETGEHPEFNFSKTLGDVVVSLHAEAVSYTHLHVWPSNKI